MKLSTGLVFLFMLLPINVAAVVDTLQDTTDINDALIYNYENCTPEETGEDCRRYNGGKVINLGIGSLGIGTNRLALFSFPGWNGELPDSARFDIYCSIESDTEDRLFFAYPLTTPFIEGTELTYGVGDYPDPDSGATWYHAYLDVGDADSLNWATAGGDYITAVACTTQITGAGQYFSFDHFERILTYFDSSGNDYGIVVVNQNAFPINSAAKVIKSSEAGSSFAPRLILYSASSAAPNPRRRRQILNSHQN